MINLSNGREYFGEEFVVSRSYLPLTGKYLGISIPPDEIEIYSDILGKDI